MLIRVGDCENKLSIGINQSINQSLCGILRKYRVEKKGNIGDSKSNEIVFTKEQFTHHDPYPGVRRPTSRSVAGGLAAGVKSSIPTIDEEAACRDFDKSRTDFPVVNRNDLTNCLLVSKFEEISFGRVVSP